MKKKTFIVQLLDSKKPNRKSFTQVEDANFYSNDTDASLVFIPHEDTFDFESAKVVMYNRSDESLVERDMQVATEDGRKVASYEMPDEIISHWGEWIAQPVFINNGEIYSGSIVPFSVIRYLMDNRPPTLRDVVKIDELYSQLVTVMDEIAGKDVISAPEIILARGGENTLGERLDKEHNEVTAQLAQTVKKTDSDLTLNNFTESDRAVIQGLAQGEINAVLGDRNVVESNLALDLVKRMPHDTVELVNLATNGDFSNGSNNWTISRGTVSVINGVATLTPSEANGSLSKGVLTIAGHKYYVCAIAYMNNTQRLRVSGAVSNDDHYGLQGDFSAIYQSNGTALDLRFDSRSSLEPFTVDQLMVIDVTESYGVGNEPSIERMDNIINYTGYFDKFIISAEGVSGQLHDLDTYARENIKGVNQEILDIQDVFNLEISNLYQKSTMYIPNRYVSTSGVMINTNDWGMALVPIEGDAEHSLWLGDGVYTGAIGAIGFYDADLNLTGSQYDTSVFKGYHEGKGYIDVQTPPDTSFLGVTVKRPDVDNSDKFILVKGSYITVGSEKRYKLNSTSTSDGEYVGVKWTVVGDSLTEINARSTKFYHEYIAEEHGFVVTNMGVSGTGYARTAENNTAFYQRINNIPLDTEVVTIFGSFNDLGSTLPLGTSRDTGVETIAGCINTTLDNLNTKLPLVPVGIITPTPWHTTRPWIEGSVGNLYVDLMLKICQERGLPVLDLYHTSGLRPWEESYRTLVYDKDPVGNGTHPNEIGHELISKRVREFIKSLI